MAPAGAAPRSVVEVEPTTATQQFSLFTGLLLVGLLWGGTNPFLREATLKRSGELEDPSSSPTSHPNDRTSKRFSPTRTTRTTTLSLRTLWGVLSHASFYLPFVLNQTGSLVYYLLLGTYEVSVMVPAANGIALLVTALTEFVLCRWRGAGEESRAVPHPTEVLGMMLILAGFALCTRAAEGG